MVKTKRMFTVVLALLLAFALIGCHNAGLGIQKVPGGTQSSGVQSFPTSQGTTPSSDLPPTSLPPTFPSSPVSPDSPTKEPKKVSSFTMLTAGDNLLHTGLLRDGQIHAGAGEDFHFDGFYEEIQAQVAAADYAIINQESIILAKRYLSNNAENYLKKSTGGSFVTPVEMLDTLKRLGFDAIDMANNHALDMGSAAGLHLWHQRFHGDRLQRSGVSVSCSLYRR